MGTVSGRGKALRIERFGGLDWGQTENNMKPVPLCRTLDSVNFLCDRGGLYRRSLETAWDTPTAPGCGVRILSLHTLSRAAGGGLQSWLVAGVALSGARTGYDLLAWGPGLTGWQSILGDQVLSRGDFVAAACRFCGDGALILSNGADPVLRWTGSGAATVLSPDAPRGRALAVSNGRLWLATADGLQVCGSALGDAADWSGADALALNLPGMGAEPVTALQSFRDSLLIFTTGSVHRLFGSQSADWQLVPLSVDAGCAAQHAVTAHHDRVYFANGSALAVYDGATVEPFGNGRLPPENLAAPPVNLLVHRNLLHLGNGLAVDLRSGEIIGVQLSGSALSWSALAALPTGELLAAYRVDASNSALVNLGSMHLAAESGGLNARFRVPCTDLGSADTVKRLTGVYVNGRGGRLRVTPLLDGAAGAPADCVLGELFAVVPMPLGGAGRLVGLVVDNPGGDPVWINGITLCYDEEVD